MANKSRFSFRPPYEKSKDLARIHNCDISVPNGPGIGNVLCYSVVVEGLSRRYGRRIKLLSAPIKPVVGKSVNDCDLYPVWENNPYVKDIVNANEIDLSIIDIINREKDDSCQFSHVIENLCYAYGMFPKEIKPQIFLSLQEMSWAMDFLSSFKRPVVVFHPFGKTSPRSTSDWYEDNWNKLINSMGDHSFIQLGLKQNDHKEIEVPYFDLTLRQTIAVIWASDLFVGFDSSLAHFATGLRKKAIVLWDVTRKESIESNKEVGFGGGMMLRWAYPQNKNLMLLGERNNEIYELVREAILKGF